MSDKEENKKEKVRLKPVGKKRRTDETKLELSKKICDKYAEGLDTIESTCNHFGVPYTTFKDWATEEGKYSLVKIVELYKEAMNSSEENYDKLLKNKAKESLLRKVGYTEIEEIHEETSKDKDGNSIGTKTKTVNKIIPPTDNSIIFALTNKDSDNFKNRHSVDGNVKIKVSEDDMNDWTSEDFEREQKRLKKIIKKGKEDRKKG
jgi:hypothetical protein